MKWYNPECEPFKIYGFAFYNKEKLYRRLPVSPKYNISDAVYGLADETAGGQIRFRAKFKELSLAVSLKSKPGFYENIKGPHLAETLRESFDIYLSEDGEDYIFYGVSMNMAGTRYYESKCIEFDEEKEYDVLLNFPAYGGVDKVLIGLDDEAEVCPLKHKFKDDRKIIVYGTSIQQGACAGRAGMIQSNLLSRWLNREVYNLGFNSNGKAESDMAKLISEIEDTAALLMSIEGNCPDSQWLDEKLREFIKVYRRKKSDTPIIIMPFIASGRTVLTPGLNKRSIKDKEIQQKIVEDFRKSGDENIYLLIQDDSLVKEMGGHSVWHEATVDGLHYNDLGFYWTTGAQCQFLKEKIGL